MSKQVAITALTVAVGTVFTVSLANSPLSIAAENPFSMKPLSGGHMMVAQAKCGEGKCGEGKCGAGKGEEGACGLYRMDADGDGKVSKEEFMKGHEGMFQHIDQNDDGVIDEAEREAHMKEMFGSGKQGRCGEGKCGGSK
jgi:uncharacterized low-complexity protein